MTLICETCENEFVPTNNRQKYCSHKCYYVVLKQRTKEENRKRYQRSIKDVICEYCGTKSKRIHGNQRYCDDDCRIKAGISRFSAVQTEVVKSTCPFCGVKHKGSSAWEYCYLHKGFSTKSDYTEGHSLRA